jgi:hypothetical protein
MLVPQANAGSHAGMHVPTSGLLPQLASTRLLARAAAHHRESVSTCPRPAPGRRPSAQADAEYDRIKQWLADVEADGMYVEMLQQYALGDTMYYAGFATTRSLGSSRSGWPAISACLAGSASPWRRQHTALHQLLGAHGPAPAAALCLRYGRGQQSQ